MLSSLHKDHLNIARLLTLLKQKLAAIRNEQPVSYFLLRDVVDYLREVSDKYHHPKEDMIYDYYLKYRVVEGEVANRLHEEHARLLDAGTELKEMVEMILMDAVIPLEQFTARLEEFIAQQEAHHCQPQPFQHLQAPALLGARLPRLQFAASLRLSVRRGRAFPSRHHIPLSMPVTRRA